MTKPDGLEFEPETTSHSVWYKSKMYISLEVVVQIKQKWGTVVENSHPRSFLGGMILFLCLYLFHVCDFGCVSLCVLGSVCIYLRWSDACVFRVCVCVCGSFVWDVDAFISDMTHSYGA